jgi:hypothetical protein
MCDVAWDLQINATNPLPVSIVSLSNPSNADQTNKASTENKKKTNQVSWVRERTIPTERPPLVGEVSANVCG